MCLSIWSKSPKIYEELKQSKVLILPSGCLLSLYKNSVQQNAGFNEEVLDWMVVEMRKLNLDAFGKEGGIILDEMAIQVCQITCSYYAFDSFVVSAKFETCSHIL